MTLDVSRAELSKAAQRAAELYVEIYAGLEDRRVDPGIGRDEMASLLRDTIAEEGVGMDATLSQFASDILPNSMGTPHPMYWGLVNSSPLPAGPLADLLLSSLNNNGGAFHQSPAITTTEQTVIKEFAKLCGWGDEAAGMILPGGTFANLQGLLLARHHHFPEWTTQGPLALTKQPRLYCSDVTHFCNSRSAIVMGLGENGIVNVPTTGRGAIDVDQLEQAINRDISEGHRPFAVVANAGTTGTGALDSLSPIADICQQHQLWFHVDACYGGGTLLLSPKPQQLTGLERADSIAIDPHKWFFVPMTAGLLMTRHLETETDLFDTAAPYIPGDGTVDAFRRGIPTSRRSSGLTIWMALRAHGWRVIREAVARNIDLTRLLEERLAESGFRILPGGELSIACARWEPTDLSSEAIDELQLRIAKHVVDTGQAWFSTVKHEQQLWLRLNLVNLYTQVEHVDRMAKLLEDAARDCSPST